MSRYTDEEEVLEPPPKPYRVAPNILDMQSYLVSVRDPLRMLCSRVEQYLIERYQNRNSSFNIAEKVREFQYNQTYVLEIVSQYLCTQSELETETMYQKAWPYFSQVGVPEDVSSQFLRDFLSFVIQIVGSVFPDMSFGLNKIVNFNVVTGDDLMITVYDDLDA